MAVAPDNDSCTPLVIGGYDCDFVEAPPDSLQCSVCLLPFRDPSLPSCCGHKGCASCLSRVKAAGHPCPMCQQPFTMVLDKYFQRKVLDLRVYCSKKEEGCRWEGELRHLQTHLQSDCSHVEEECQYKCGKSYQRCFLQDHEMDECPRRPPEVVTQSLMRKMAERIDKLEAIRQEDQNKLAAVQSNLADIERNQQNDRTKLVVVKKAHREDQAKLNQQIQVLQNENTSLRDEKRKITKKMDELQEQIQQQSKRLLSLVPVYGPGWLMDAKGTLSSPYPPCQIIMPQFSQHKRDKDRWYSQPFYSAPGGYKLFLSVHANGFANGADTYVSVYVHLMKGENDEQLKWPFVHDVTCGILNWKKDENHRSCIIYFKNADECCNGRLILGQNDRLGWGYHQFLPHSSLYGDAAGSTQFLNEDCLCLQVLNVEPPK